MAIAHDVSWSNNENASGSTSIALGSATPAAGACITGWLCGPPSSANPSIADSAGGTVTIVAVGSTAGTNAFGVFFFYEPNVSAVARTLTANWTGTFKSGLIADSFTGLAASTPYDQSTFANSGGSNVNTQNSATTNTLFNGTSLALGFCCHDNNAALTSWNAAQFSGNAQTAGLGNSTTLVGFDEGYYLTPNNGALFATASFNGTAAPLYAGIAIMSSVNVTGGGGINPYFPYGLQPTLAQ